MDDPKKPKRIIIDLEDLDHEVAQSSRKPDRLSVNDQLDSSENNLITINKEDLYSGAKGYQTNGMESPAVSYSTISRKVIRCKNNWKVALVITLPLLLVFAAALFIINSEEEYAVEVKEPAEELQEKLELTDQQLQMIKSGSGTIHFSNDQIKIFREPVESSLEFLDEHLDEKDYHEVAEMIDRLLNEGEADLVQLNNLAEKLLTVNDSAETAISFEFAKTPGLADSQGVHIKQPDLNTVKGPASNGLSPITPAACSANDLYFGLKQLSSGETGANQNFTTVTTLYTPQESNDGEGHYELKNEFGTGIMGQPNYKAKALPATGAVFGASTSWIGSDRGTALVGITFEVPQDNTAVEITSTIKHISAQSGVGLVINLAGTWIPFAFENNYDLRSETLINPYTWKKGVDVMLSVLAPFAAIPKGIKAVKEAISFAAGSLSMVELVNAMNNMEGTETTVKTVNVGVLDQGTYQFQVGVKAATSAFVTDYVHAAVFGQVQSIEVTQMFYPEPEPEPELEPEYGTIPWTIGPNLGGKMKDGTYTGELKDGVPHGQGKWTRPAGEEYVGEWENGDFNGHGTWSGLDDHYVGEWKDNLLHGKGVYTYEGHVWDATFKKGVFQEGTYTTPEGEVFYYD